MRTKLLFYTFLLSIIGVSCSNEEASKESKLNKLFNSALDKGDAEGIYQLYYDNIIIDSMLSREDKLEYKLKYLTKSSELGYLKGFNQLLSEFYWNAGLVDNSTSGVSAKSRPTIVYDAYIKGRKLNKEFDGVDYIEYLKKTMEVEPFNLDEFISNNNVLIDEYYLEGPFSAWIIAEEASKDGKFGVANPKLVLQLVSRGGFSDSERVGAIDFAYENWKYNKNQEFKLCNHVTSSYGYETCKGKEREKELQKIKMEILTLKDKVFSDELSIYFDRVFNTVCKFYEAQQFDEAIIGYGFGLHGQTEAMDNIEIFKYQYINVVKKINNHSYNDSISLVINSYDNFSVADSHDVKFDWDKELNLKYNQIVDDLNNGYRFNKNYDIKALKKVQLLWIRYRDETAVLFHKLDISKSEEYWKNLLTRDRVYQLEQLYEMIEKPIK